MEHNIPKFMRRSKSSSKKEVYSHTTQTQEIRKLGVPIMAQWKRIQLGTKRLQVQSLASLSGLRIRHCHELWCKFTNAARIWRGCGSGVGWQL